MILSSARRGGKGLCFSCEGAIDVSCYWRRCRHAICAHGISRCTRAARVPNGGTEPAEGAQIVEMMHDRYTEVALHRLHGDLLRTTGDLLGADQIYRRQLLSGSGRTLGVLNSARPSASPASGATKASAPKPMIYSHPSTAGSPKASTRRSYKTPRRCSTSCVMHDSRRDLGQTSLVPLPEYCRIAI